MAHLGIHRNKTFIVIWLNPKQWEARLNTNGTSFKETPLGSGFTMNGSCFYKATGFNYLFFVIF